MGWFPRENYLKKIRDFYHAADIIKVITGVRRCGKSCLMETIADELKKSGIHEENILYFDLDSKEYNKIVRADQLEQLIQDIQQESIQVREAAPERRTDMSRYRTEKDTVSSVGRADGGGDPLLPKPPTGAGASRQPQEPVRVEKKAGRNDPCPCGSGKKYKNCHGKGL